MSHQGRAEVKDHLLWPFGNTFPNAEHKAICFLFCKVTLLSQGQLGVHQDSQVPFCSTAFHLVSPQPLLGHGVITSQGQDFALPFYELHVIPASPFLQPVKVPMDDSMTLRCISCFLQFCVICRLAEGTVCPSTGVINKDFKQSRPLDQPLGLATGDWSPIVILATDWNPLSLVVQPVLSSPHSPLL